jgi:hypothetical protein
MKIYELNESHDDEIFRKLLNKKQAMNKGKIIGWKLKDIEISVARLRDALRIAFSINEVNLNAGPNILKERFNYNPDGDHPYSFAVNSYCEAKLKEAALLHEMFDPVYESDRKHTSEKIIGYKLPVTIHVDEGPVQAGHLFVHDKCFPAYYFPKGTIMDSNKYKIPREIAETWEPVYEKEYIELNINNQIIKIYKGKIVVDNGNEISHEEVKTLFNAVRDFPKTIHGSINNYPIEFDSIKVGCTRFVRKDIVEVLSTYQDFNNKDK